ncbi:DNA-binding protein [Trinickia symbiotica]|uniref:DNA-binding protein n=1 Tax=Trinickia symbiotica TaxID=863227 RepID=UPI0026B4BE50
MRAGLADIAMPGIPPDIAEQLRALWQAAVTVQLDDVVRLKADAQQAIAAADAACTDAQLRVELLRQELTELRTVLTGRDAELADLRAQHTLIRERCAALEATLQDRQDRQDRLDAAVAEREALERAHAEWLAEAQHRYEALSKQLLQETAHQRAALKKEHEQFASQLKFAERRIAALEGERERLEAELFSERATRQQAVGEALALKAVNSSQHAQLDELMRVVSALEVPRRAPAASPGLATARRTKTTPKGGSATRPKKR